MEVLIKGSDEEFEEFLIEHVKQEFPEKAAERDEETLREMVRGGIQRAERHGLTLAEDVAAFISIMFEIAPNFDEQPQIKSVLDDKSFAPEDRIGRLWSPPVTEEAWTEAEKNYNENAWFPER
jgi:hypothetical protein